VLQQSFANMRWGRGDREEGGKAGSLHAAVAAASAAAAVVVVGDSLAGVVDRDGAAVQLLSVEGIACSGSAGSIHKCDEGETTGAAGVTIHHDLRFALAILGESLLQRLVVYVPG